MSKRTIIVNATVITGFAEISDCGIFIENDGKIADIFNMRRFKEKEFPSDTVLLDANGAFVTPGFIDTHTHGIGGFGTEDGDSLSILQMSSILADFGVTAFLPTVYTETLDKMIKATKAIVSAMGKEKGAKILGVNLEGPFISPKRIGAQSADGVQEVNFDTYYKLLKAGQGKIICMTVAPELKRMRELALEARKDGIVLLAGHTNATYENIMEGMQCGILHTTHFFNAMSRLHHRNPNAVGAIMIQPDMNCEIIADGVHVHPEIIKLLLREKPISNIVMITDSLKPTKQESGELLANGVEAILSKEGAFVSKKDPSLFLGSSLVLIDAIKNMSSWGVPISNIIQMVSTNPSRIYSFNKIGTLVPGNFADITIFDKNFHIKGVFVNGNLIRNNF